MQHINCYPKRRAIWEEIFRVLKPGGWFTAQMGYGPGHSKAVDYYNEEEVSDRDCQVLDHECITKDLYEIGFIGFKYDVRPPNHDEHPNWIWFKARKPE